MFIYTSSFWWRAQRLFRLIDITKPTTTSYMLSTSWYLFFTRYKKPHKTISYIKSFSFLPIFSFFTCKLPFLTPIWARYYHWYPVNYIPCFWYFNFSSNFLNRSLYMPNIPLVMRTYNHIFVIINHKIQVREMWRFEITKI